MRPQERRIQRLRAALLPVRYPVWMELVKPRTDKQQAQRIERILKPWLMRLDMHNTWDTLVKFASPATMEEETGDREALALVTTNLPYKHVVITVSRSYVAESSDKDLEHTLLHELVHVLLAPMVFIAERNLHPASRVHFVYEHESVTDTITNLLLWDIKGKRQTPK